jgi:hypothetical protein
LKKISIKKLLVGRYAIIFWPFCLLVLVKSLGLIPNFYPNVLGMTTHAAERDINLVAYIYLMIVYLCSKQWLVAALITVALVSTFFLP